jgi:glucose-1-phosphate thymidylyltransferase
VKGIVLAGGTGSRLWPITRSVSKQLLPVYDKPMIYYPISTLMLAGIQDILIISNPQDQKLFYDLLGDGSNLGVRFQYAIQAEPKGIAQAFTIGENFLAGDSCMLILGDNIFHGAGLGRDLARNLPNSGAHIFTYEVTNPSDYGVLELDQDLLPISITEKPSEYISNLAITGLYFFDSDVVEIARTLQPSQRGEIEITSVLNSYLKIKKLTYSKISRGAAWLDTGNPMSLHDAGTFVRILEERTGLKVGCIDEISFQNNWITRLQLLENIQELGKNHYSSYLKRILESNT